MNHFYFWYKTGRNFANALVCYGLFLMLMLAASLPGFANTFVVNNSGDFAAVNLTTGEGAPGQICLRSAVQAATGIAGSHTISFSITGTITLTLGQMTLGNASNGNNITISGPGMDVLTVNQTTENRIFSTGTGAVTVSIQNITLNYTGPAVTAYSGGGGAIIAGGAGASTTLINCRISNFQRQLGNGGAISASSSLANHSLTLTNCIFTNNKCGGAGGAVSFNSQGGTATITGCTFSGNKTGPVGANTGGDGGAISVTGGGSGGTYLIEKNTFLNNQVENVTGHAGAVINTNGTLTLRFNRFVGNTCANVSFPPLANVIAQAGGATTHVTIADNNWWGVNTGPGTNDATALAAGAVMTLTKWLQLKTTASPNPVCASTPSSLGNTSTVTTSFLSNSASEAIAVGNLPVLIGLPVTWSSTLGSLSGQQGTIQAAGTATALFTSNGTGGTATVNAQVDNIPAGETTPARANITVNTLSAAPTGATGTTTICTGDNTILTVAGGSKGTGATTQWFTGSCGGTPAGTGDAITVSPAATTTYYVRYSGTCNTTTCATVTVTVNIPSVAPTGVTGNTTICEGSSTMLTVAGGSKGTAAVTQWFTGSCGGTPAGTGDAITVSPATTTTYYVRYSGTCNATTCATVTVIVYTLSTAPTGVTGTTTICSGGSTTLTVSGGSKGTGATAVWYTGDCGGPTSVSAEDSYQTPSLTSNQTYYVRYSGNCNSTACVTVLVTVKAPPIISAPTVTQPTCITPTGTIVVNATGDGTLEYQLNGGTWQLSNSFGSLSPGNYNIAVRLQSLPGCATTYSGNPVVLNAATGCCVAPNITSPTVTQPTCAIPTGTIVVNATGSGALEYQLNAGDFQASNSFSGLAPGNYNITVRLQSSPSCLSTYSGNPVVLNAATGCCVAPNITAPNVTQPTCAIPTGTIVVNATGSGALEYQLNAGAFQASNTFSGLAPGNYNITVRLQSSPSCLSTYSGNPVVLNAATGCCVAPNITAPSVTQPTCAIPTGTIVVNATGSGTLEYQLNAGAFQASNTFSGLAPGNYNITVRLQSSPGCLSTYSGNPVVLNAATGCCVAPNITAPNVTQPTCAIPTGTIVVNATGSGALEYQLNAGDFQASNSFSGLAPGNYNITVRLQSSPGCLSTYSGNPVVLNTPTGCGGCGPVTAILYVNAAVASSGAGSDWSCAMKELSEAVAYANTHPAVKSIWVAKGTYKPTTSTDRSASMVINRADLQIIGGFAGGETSVLQANIAVNPTIVTGEIGAIGMADNSYHLFKIFNIAANANPLVISGFIMGQGNANVAGSGNNYGGAALVYNVNAGATVRFMQCVFGQNNAVQGGAIYFNYASAQFDRCIFGLNTATTYGGAVFGFFSASKYERVVFSQNMAGSAGGAYYTNYGTEEFNKVAFSTNTVPGAGGGGAVYQNASNCNYFNTVFENNSAGLGGGIVAYNGSMSRVVNSTFFSNQATTWGGGALYLGTNNSQADVQNSIFWKNRKAGSDNVAMADVSYNTGSNVFRNNILQANSAVPADNGINITNNKRGVDPLFVNEANPGGIDFLFGTADDGLQLQVGSPAVNAGNNAATTGAGLTQDLRDNPRIVCSIVDMGAYEKQDCAPSLVAQAKKVDLALTAIVTNPFSSELLIRYSGNEKCSVVIYSSTGQAAWQSLEIPAGLTRVVTSSWGTGMYLVVLNTASGKQLTFKALKF